MINELLDKAAGFLGKATELKDSTMELAADFGSRMYNVWTTPSMDDIVTTAKVGKMLAMENPAEAVFVAGIAGTSLLTSVAVGYVTRKRKEQRKKLKINDPINKKRIIKVQDVSYAPIVGQGEPQLEDQAIDLEIIEPSLETEVLSLSSQYMQSKVTSESIIGADKKDMLTWIDTAENLDRLASYDIENGELVLTKHQVARDSGVSANKAEKILAEYNEFTGEDINFSAQSQNVKELYENSENLGDIAQSYINSKTRINGGNADLVRGKAERLQALYEKLQEGITLEGAATELNVTERTANSYLETIKGLTDEKIEFKPIIALDEDREEVVYRDEDWRDLLSYDVPTDHLEHNGMLTDALALAGIMNGTTPDRGIHTNDGIHQDDVPPGLAGEFTLTYIPPPLPEPLFPRPELVGAVSPISAVFTYALDFLQKFT